MLKVELREVSQSRASLLFLKDWGQLLLRGGSRSQGAVLPIRRPEGVIWAERREGGASVLTGAPSTLREATPYLAGHYEFYTWPMCDRFASYLPAKDLRRIFRTVNPLPNLRPSWNVAPSQSALVVHLDANTGERHLGPMAWGLLPHRIRANIQAKTVIQMSMLRGSLAQWRCIVPAGAYYERQKRTQRQKRTDHMKPHYAVARRDGLPMAFAGLWTTRRLPDDTALRSFMIITTAATQDAAALHPRMPVILEPADWQVWLGEVDGDPTALLHPPAVGTLRTWRVENQQGNGPELLDPIMDDAGWTWVGHLLSPPWP